MDGGAEMNVSDIVNALLAPEGEPRDGITILGGEPFLQPDGLLATMLSLKERDQHITLYTGYTLKQLMSRHETEIRRILEITDILIDGPFVKELSANAGEWLGSTNQTITRRPASLFSTSSVTS